MSGEAGGWLLWASAPVGNAGSGPVYNPQGSAEATWAAGAPMAQCYRPFSIRRVFPSPMKSLQKR